MSQATVSDDVKMPLTSILMLLESLAKICMDYTQNKIIQVIVSQVNLLLCLFNDMIDLKLIENGHFETRKKEFRPLETF